MDEANISTPVAVDQRAANCLEEVVRHSPPCGASVGRPTLTLSSVVNCQFFVLFGARRSTPSKLAILCNCSAAHELLLLDRKTLLLEGR
ncbi:hypothetical protein TNCV_3117081 [Trichonephila clavipes]|nr:hypothetical protein TNCV_3117081 [Trichonephila clavipes]